MPSRYIRIQQSFQRVRSFSPLICIYLLGFVGVGIRMIWGEYGPDLEAILWLAMLMIGLGMIFTLSFQKSELSRTGKRLAIGTISASLFIWHQYLGVDVSYSQGIQLILTFLIGVFGVVAIPYLKRASTDKMIYDRVISTIYQVVVSVIFSILLGGGISLSLLAIESLFSVDIVNEWYPTIWLLAFSLVGIISLVDGIAGEDLDGKEEKTTQKWKSMLALVLSILLLIFGAILYVYMAKIIVTRNWPSNEVAFWGFFFAGLVIIASIILLPELDLYLSETKRIRRRGFVLLIPVCIVVALAIGQRIGQYGITEERYLAVVALLWLVAMSVYMILSKKAHMYVLFTSLIGCMAFSAFAWPLNASSVSYRRQLGRLETTLTDFGLLENGSLTIPEKGSLTNEQEEQLAGILGYFANKQKKGVPSIDPRLADPEDLFDTFNIEDRYWYGGDRNAEDRRNIYLSSTTPRDIEGYSKLYTNIYLNEYAEENKLIQGEITVSYTNEILTIILDENEYEFDLIPLRPHWNQMSDTSNNDLQEETEPTVRPVKSPNGDITDTTYLTLENDQIKVLITQLSYRLGTEKEMGSISNMSVVVMVK